MGRTIGRRAGSAQLTERRCPTYAAPADGLPIPAPQFGNSPDSGRPPAEHVPGGWPATTVPVESSIPLPMTSTDPINGLSPELVAPPVLQRAHNDAARDTSYCASVRIPDPQFPHKTPAGRRSSSCPAPLPAPGGQPDPSRRTTGPSIEQLRWVRCPDDKHLHLLHPADVLVAVGGHAPAVCGQRISAEGFTITKGPSGALCMTCIAEATALTTDLRLGGTS